MGVKTFGTRFAGLPKVGIALHSRAGRRPAHSFREKYFFTGKASEKMILFSFAFCGKRNSARLRCLGDIVLGGGAWNIERKFRYRQNNTCNFPVYLLLY